MVESRSQTRMALSAKDLRRTTWPKANHTLESMGVFSYNDSVFHNNKYGYGPSAESRTFGKQFMTNPAKWGMGMDATFTPFKSLHQGDVYTSPEDRRRAYEREKRAKNLVPQPFKPSSPTKQQSGYGTFTYGMINQQKVPNQEALQADSTVATSTKKSKEKIRKPLERRNFLTSPAKMGSYGSIGLNIGGRVSGVVGEYEYHPHSNGERPLGSTTPSTLRAFTPSNPGKRGTYGYHGLNIGGVPQGTFGEYAYQSVMNESSFGSLTSRSEGSTSKGVRPFVPSTPAKVGAGNYGCLGRYPEFIPDPETERMAAQKAERAREKAKIKGPVFRPTSNSKSIRQPSVLGLKANQLP